MTLSYENGPRTAVKRLRDRSLKANKKRNFFIAVAIMLTTLLIGSVFSVGMSLIESVKMEQLRFAGTMAHAAIGHPTDSQMEQLRNLDYVKTVGSGNNVGYIRNSAEMGKISLTLHYFDEVEWEELRSPVYMDIEGQYPEKESEIMVSLSVLKKIGIDKPTIGMEIPLTYYTDSENEQIQGTFYLSGWFTNYALVQSAEAADMILVSRELSQKYGKTVEKDGSASVVFVDESRITEYCDALVSDLDLSEEQQVATVQIFSEGEGQEIAVFLSLGAIAFFLVFTGYLLIYNVLYSSVSRDVRFYGLLKTLGVTPKQIERIVIGQIVRLCIIAIPVGIICSLLFSLYIVPFFIAQLGIVSAKETVVSFSPFIFIGAVIFPLLTAMLGALKPARKAAKISPIAAQKYTGVKSKTKQVHFLTHGKLYRMALRNVFRDKKRASVVLLSLFLGLTTFLTITTMVFSIDVTKYIDSTFEGDFVLENNAWSAQKFNAPFIEQLEAIPGLESLHTTTWSEMFLDYSEDFDEYIAAHPMQEQIAALTEQDIADIFKGFILGVDGETLTKYDDAFGNPIDAEAFERGEIALIATDSPELFSNINTLTIYPSEHKENVNLNKFEIGLGGFVPFEYKGIGSGLAPTVIVSNSVMQERFQNSTVLQVGLNVSEYYEQSSLMGLKKIVGQDSEISLTSKTEATAELNRAKMSLMILGGSISLVIALIGILNFVNIMSVNIMVRKRELAILQAIGMSRKQIKKMLISEGLFYAAITLIFVLTLGNAVTYTIFKLFQHQVSFAVFTYPGIPMCTVALIIIIICFVTPERTYHSIAEKEISEQLKESE